MGEAVSFHWNNALRRINIFCIGWSTEKKIVLFTLKYKIVSHTKQFKGVEDTRVKEKKYFYSSGCFQGKFTKAQVPDPSDNQ